MMTMITHYKGPKLIEPSYFRKIATGTCTALWQKYLWIFTYRMVEWGIILIICWVDNQIYFEKIFVNYPGSEMKTSKRKDLKIFESCQNMIITGIIRLTKTSWRRVLKDISSKLNESRDANNSVYSWTVQRFFHDRHVVKQEKMVVPEINRKRCVAWWKLQWIIIATLHISWWKLGSFRKYWFIECTCIEHLKSPSYLLKCMPPPPLLPRQRRLSLLVLV